MYVVLFFNKYFTNIANCQNVFSVKSVCKLLLIARDVKVWSLDLSLDNGGCEPAPAFSGCCSLKTWNDQASLVDVDWISSQASKRVLLKFVRESLKNSLSYMTHWILSLVWVEFLSLLETWYNTWIWHSSNGQDMGLSYKYYLLWLFVKIIWIASTYIEMLHGLVIMWRIGV